MDVFEFSTKWEGKWIWSSPRAREFKIIRAAEQKACKSINVDIGSTVCKMYAGCQQIGNMMGGNETKD